MHIALTWYRLGYIKNSYRTNTTLNEKFWIVLNYHFQSIKNHCRISWIKAHNFNLWTSKHVRSDDGISHIYIHHGAKSIDWPKQNPFKFIADLRNGCKISKRLLCGNSSIVCFVTLGEKFSFYNGTRSTTCAYLRAVTMRIPGKQLNGCCCCCVIVSPE